METDREAGGRLERRLRMAAGALPLLVAVSAGELTAQAGKPLPAVEPIGRVGCAACEGPEAFGAIQDLAILPSGEVVVADRDEPMIRVFDAHGEHRASFGKRGDGPGELRTLGGIAGLVDGRILVADMRRPALQVYSTGGDVLEGRRLDRMVMDLQASPDGRRVALQEAHWSTMSAGVRTFDGSNLDDLATPVADTRGVLVDGEGEAAGPGLFSASPASDGTLALGHGDVYRILLLEPSSGKVRREITRDLPRARRTPEELDRLREAIRAASRLRGRNPEGRSEIAIDPLHPHFEQDGLTWDADGRLWVRTPRGGLEATIFDVFDSAGAFLGEVRVDVRLRLHALAADRLAGVAADPATGVERVHVWRIR